MAEHISYCFDVSGNEHAHDFQTGTIVGHSDLEVLHGTRKCFRIAAIRKNQLEDEPVEIIMPKYQALTVADQIAHQFGYKIVKDK